MRLKNFLLVVENIQVSKAFYKELFGLDVITDFDTNVILTGGLVLQQRHVWEELIGVATTYGGHASELYFETWDLEGFLDKLRSSSWEIRYPEMKMAQINNRSLVRLYDPDGHLIEVAAASCVRQNQ